jgi:hypothetical protein
MSIKRFYGKGRGVVADVDYTEGDLIETCHVILGKCAVGDQNPFQGYVFRWSKTQVALLLGAGSLYNHSYNPNVRVVVDKPILQCHLLALRDIRAGEELCFSYTGRKNKADLGFKVR